MKFKKYLKKRKHSDYLDSGNQAYIVYPDGKLPLQFQIVNQPAGGAYSGTEKKEYNMKFKDFFVLEEGKKRRKHVKRKRRSKNYSHRGMVWGWGGGYRGYTNNNDTSTQQGLADIGSGDDSLDGGSDGGDAGGDGGGGDGGGGGE